MVRKIYYAVRGSGPEDNWEMHAEKISDPSVLGEGRAFDEVTPLASSKPASEDMLKALRESQQKSIRNYIAARRDVTAGVLAKIEELATQVEAKKTEFLGRMAKFSDVSSAFEWSDALVTAGHEFHVADKLRQVVVSGDKTCRHMANHHLEYFTERLVNGYYDVCSSSPVDNAISKLRRQAVSHYVQYSLRRWVADYAARDEARNYCDNRGIEWRDGLSEEVLGEQGTRCRV